MNQKATAIVRSVLRRQGLTSAGVQLCAKRFGESHTLVIVMQLPYNNTEQGVALRLLAMAFAITQPRAMRP